MSLMSGSCPEVLHFTVLVTDFLKSFGRIKRFLPWLSPLLRKPGMVFIACVSRNGATAMWAVHPELQLIQAIAWFGSTSWSCNMKNYHIKFLPHLRSCSFCAICEINVNWYLKSGVRFLIAMIFSSSFVTSSNFCQATMQAASKACQTEKQGTADLK